jgi:hypothetical protein
MTAGFVLLVPLVQADVKAPDPIPQRIARASAVFVGKVKLIEEKSIEQESYPGVGGKLTYKVAVITVTDSLLGKSNTYRVAFTRPSPRREFSHLNFQAGQEGLFFLTKVHGQPTYRVLSYEDVVLKKDNEGYETQLALAKRCAKLLANPDKGLASKEKEDRFLTAAMLVLRYRNLPMADAKSRVQETVPAARSKKILEILAESDWMDGRNPLTPQALFARLGATEKDGWKPPQDFRQYVPAAKQWLKDNAGKFAMQTWKVKGQEDDPEPK